MANRYLVASSIDESGKRSEHRLGLLDTGQTLVSWNLAVTLSVSDGYFVNGIPHHRSHPSQVTLGTWAAMACQLPSNSKCAFEDPGRYSM